MVEISDIVSLLALFLVPQVLLAIACFDGFDPLGDK